MIPAAGCTSRREYQHGNREGKQCCTTPALCGVYDATDEITVSENPHELY